MILNAMISEVVSLLEHKVGTATSTPLVTTYVDTRKTGHRFTAIALLGDMANETIDVAIFKASDSSGTGAVSLKAATQLAGGVTSNDNQAVIVEIDSSEIDLAKPFIAVQCTTGGATGGVVGLVLLMAGQHHGPISDNNTRVLEVKR